MSLLNTIFQFLPIAVFWIVQYLYGLKPAIAVTIAMVVAGIVWKLVRREQIQKLYLFSGALVIVFGAIDLYAQTPFMLKYEAVITNLVMGGIFAGTAFSRKTMIQQMVEQQSGKPLPDNPEVTGFFRFFTLFWAGYFLLKAAVYLWIGSIMPLAQAMAWRSIIGTATLVAMVGISTQGERVFFLLRRMRLLPSAGEESEV